MDNDYFANLGEGRIVLDIVSGKFFMIRIAQQSCRAVILRKALAEYRHKASLYLTDK